MNKNLQPLIFGLAGALALLGLYWSIVSLISGPSFALAQFRDYWYFIVGLAAGFGAQVGFYTHLKKLVAAGAAGGRAVVVSGAASTGAMLACCAHYLANFLPALATVGVASFIGQYQVEFFWLGLAANLLGLSYIISQIKKFTSS
ncbi:MAG: hypothetical protein AAB677_01435 [Patescibacteria group bacterium]